MKLPSQMQSARASAQTPRAAGADARGGLRLQGCNAFEWIKCGAVVAGCGSLSGPALIACVAAAAPGCIKCVT
jgi:hypothetical protein